MRIIPSMKKDSLTKASRLTLLSYFNQVVSMLALFVEGKVLTTNMDMNDYGAYNQVLTTVSLITLFLCLNLGHGFIRFASGYSFEKKKQTFHTVLLTQTFLYVLSFLLIFPFSDELSLFITGRQSIYIIVIIGVLTVLSGGISNIQNFLLVSGRDNSMIKQNLYKTIIDVVFIILFVLVYHNLMGALLGYVVGETFCLILFSIINCIDYRCMKIDFEILKELLRFSLPLLITSVAYWIINSSNRYFINYYWGLDTVGQFAIANKLPVMIVTIFTLLSTIFLSNTSRLYDSGNIERVSYWFNKITKIFVILSVSGSVLLIASHHALTLILSTPEYLFDGIAQFYLWLCTGSILFGLFLIISKVYDLEKKVKLISGIWAAILFTNIVLNFLLIPRNGLLGSAWATLLTFLLGFLLAFVMRPKNISFNISWLKIAIYIVACLVIAYFYSEQSARWGISVGVEIIFAFIFAGISLALGFCMKIVRFSEIKELVFKETPNHA